MSSKIEDDRTLFDPLLAACSVEFSSNMSGLLICGLCQSCLGAGNRRVPQVQNRRTSLFNKEYGHGDEIGIDPYNGCNKITRRYSDSELIRLKKEQLGITEKPYEKRLFEAILEFHTSDVTLCIADQEIMGCSLYPGQIYFEFVNKRYLIKDGQSLMKRSVCWNKFLREHYWGEQFVKESCMVKLYGTGMSTDDNVSTPAVLIYPRYSANLFQLLVKKHELLSRLKGPVQNDLILSLQSMELSEKDIFHTVKTMVEAIELLVSWEAVHTHFLPDSVNMMFTKRFPVSAVLGHLGAVFSSGHRVKEEELQTNILPPEVLKGLQENGEFALDESVMLWQFGVLAGMIADTEFFGWFFENHLSVRIREDIDKNAYEFSCSLQAEVEELFSINSISATGVILSQRSLSSLSKDDCFTQPPSVEGVLLIISWFLLNPDTDKQPNIDEVKSFLSLFDDVFACDAAANQ
ncbi:hypothetical protein ACWJJH_00300 [Endozoicomonadaceae bacterium StTr2]